jgi:ribonuclease kappa
MCCAVISLWGIIMLVLLGVFFHVRAPALVEDISIDEAEWEKRGYEYKYIEELYAQNAINCWIAAAMYCLTFTFSVVMFKVNMRTSYVQA